MNMESSSRSAYRPSTAPGNLYNRYNPFSHQYGFPGSSRSSSPKYWESSYTDLHDDGFISEYTTYPSHCPETYRQRGQSHERIHGNRHRLGPERNGSDLGLPRYRGTHRSDIQRGQGLGHEGWVKKTSQGTKKHPHSYRRLSLSPPSGEDRTHHPAPDHRPLLHHNMVGGYGGHSPTARPQIFRPKQFHLPRPRAAADPCANSAADEDPCFRPGRGDVIIVQPNQRGRVPKRCQPRQHQGCVRSYSGDSDDFVFRNRDLIVRIGSYISDKFYGISYLPYGILELYRRHDGVWKFLGKAITAEDLDERRRNSCVEMQYCGGIGVGQNCPIEFNYGDFVIYQDKIKCSNVEHMSSDSMIDWWTPYLHEKLNMVYPQNTILLRPYVRKHSILQARESWLGKRVTRVDKAQGGKVEEGIVVMVWPESLLQDRTPSTSHRGAAHIEVLGPDRVGVRVKSWRRKGTVAWPLTDTFLECDDLPLSSYHSVEERERLRAAPWGSIEMYIYSNGPGAGWVYWGSSEHTF